MQVTLELLGCALCQNLPCIHILPQLLRQTPRGAVSGAVRCVGLRLQILPKLLRQALNAACHLHHILLQLLSQLRVLAAVFLLELLSQLYLLAALLPDPSVHILPQLLNEAARLALQLHAACFHHHVCSGCCRLQCQGLLLPAMLQHLPLQSLQQRLRTVHARAERLELGKPLSIASQFLLHGCFEAVQSLCYALHAVVKCSAAPTSQDATARHLNRS
mmetsp:Transcript_147901/g.272836  ORF Transcript_147901/g.272836 Transcript_147901/m.272836 type:complete len:218 (+) Transcript_147901:684-1337(+)